MEPKLISTYHIFLMLWYIFSYFILLIDSLIEVIIISLIIFKKIIFKLLVK